MKEDGFIQIIFKEDSATIECGLSKVSIDHVALAIHNLIEVIDNAKDGELVEKLCELIPDDERRNYE